MMPSKGGALDAACLAAGAFGLVDELDLHLAAAVQQHLLRRRSGRSFERRLGVKAVVPRHAFQQAVRVGVAPVPALHRAGGQAQAGEGDHPFGVEHRDLAQAIAGRAGAHGAVEAEQARLQFGQRIAAHRAAELAAEEVLDAAVHLQRDGAAVGDAQAGLEALGQALRM
jgi:hypothetical protein